MFQEGYKTHSQYFNNFSVLHDNKLLLSKPLEPEGNFLRLWTKIRADSKETDDSLKIVTVDHSRYSKSTI
jgi:hypothetical protein